MNLFDLRMAMWLFQAVLKEVMERWLKGSGRWVRKLSPLQALQTKYGQMNIYGSVKESGNSLHHK